MKDLKSRAWHKKENRMLPVICIDFTGVTVIKGHPTIISQPDDGCYYLKDVELMQFTGLKDKTGKDVYEGDIVRFPAQIEPHGEGCLASFCGIGKIIWSDYDVRFVIELINKYNGYIIEISEYECEHDFKVIGNIYENPERLNE